MVFQRYGVGLSEALRFIKAKKEPSKPIYVAEIQRDLFPGVKPPQALLQPPHPPDSVLWIS